MVFLGTIISTTITSLWIEPYILFKYGLKRSTVTYFKRLAQYSVITLVASLVCSYLVSYFTLMAFGVYSRSCSKCGSRFKRHFIIILEN